jgi:hypothetical protein
VRVLTSVSCATHKHTHTHTHHHHHHHHHHHQVADHGLSQALLDRAAQLRKAAAACPELASDHGFALGGNYALIATAHEHGREIGDNVNSDDEGGDVMCKDAVTTLQFYGM